MATKIKYPVYAESSPQEYVKILSSTEMITVRFGEFKTLGHSANMHPVVTSDLVHGGDVITAAEFKQKVTEVQAVLTKAFK